MQGLCGGVEAIEDGAGETRSGADVRRACESADDARSAACSSMEVEDEGEPVVGLSTACKRPDALERRESGDGLLSSQVGLDIRSL